MSELRPCALIPTLDNPTTIERVVAGVRRHIDEIIVVDDGSGEAGRAAIERLRGEHGVQVLRHERNQGKGKAAMAGFRLARDRGFTHALMIDADGQHDPDDIPAFLAAGRASPRALVIGQPRFDHTAPRARVIGREISTFWVAVETLSRRIGDPLCGYRLYPVDAALASGVRGARMDFDPEIAVRMVRKGTPVAHVPVQVRYFTREEGGVSHFDYLHDNLRISRMHTRLVIEGIFGWLARPVRALIAPREPGS